MAADTSPVWHAGDAEVFARWPGEVTPTYPEGEPFATAHGSLTVELFVPKLEDRQQPHTQDELYLVQAGTSGFVRDDVRVRVGAGDAVFVPAGMSHRFEDSSDDVVTWVVFWGPEGGEWYRSPDVHPTSSSASPTHLVLSVPRRPRPQRPPPTRGGLGRPG